MVPEGEAKPEPDQNEEGAAELQVVQSKQDKGINREEIMRRFNEQMEKEEQEREEMEKRRIEMRHKLKEIPKTISKRSQL
jgi:hypothetical protein